MVKFSFLSLCFLCFIVRYKFQKVRAAVKHKNKTHQKLEHVCAHYPTWEIKHFRHLWISHYAILYPLPSFKTVFPPSLGLIIALVFFIILLHLAVFLNNVCLVYLFLKLKSVGRIIFFTYYLFFKNLLCWCQLL